MVFSESIKHADESAADNEADEEPGYCTDPDLVGGLANDIEL